MNNLTKKLEKFWVGLFITLWFLVSAVSTIHSVKFFQLSNDIYLSWILALSFEIGAMSSLGGLVLSKGNKSLVWFLFIVLTLFQVHCNMYWVWMNIDTINEWSNLFDLDPEENLFNSRVFSFISGGILPLISMGFIKSLMDYLDSSKSKKLNTETQNEMIDILNHSSEQLKK